MLYELSLIPILVALLILATLDKFDKKIKYIALIGSLTPLLFLPLMLQNIGTILDVNWFSVGSTAFPISISLLPINILLFALVSVIGPLVILYSWGYMDKTTNEKPFYIEMLAFQASMLAFSISGNFILIFIAWEFLSLTSYLLIGFYGKNSSIRAARKTITIILIGDVAFLVGMVLIWHAFSTFQFSSIIIALQGAAISQEVQVGMVLLLLAVFTKSAQFPFSQWLPDAMEGPTPVSAFLHSSTMVKAGVFLVIILFPIFQSAKLLPIVLVVGLVSALLAISNALYETHIKRILAYSTIEELSLMLVALGIGAFGVALYLFIVQTFYKALLFFYSGILIKANNTEDIYQMHDAYRNKMFFAAAAVGVASLAGFIPFSGFFSNISLESAAMAGSILVYGLIIIIDLAVALLIARWFVIPLRKETRKKASGSLSVNYSLVGKPMYIALYLLAALTALSVIAIIYTSGIASDMANYGYTTNPNINIDPLEAVIATVVVAIGFMLGYAIYVKKAAESNDILHSLLFNNALFGKLYLYSALFAYEISVYMSSADLMISDVFDGIGQNTSSAGGLIRKIQSGQINFYAIVFIVGLLALLAYLIFGVK